MPMYKPVNNPGIEEAASHLSVRVRFLFEGLSNNPHACFVVSVAVIEN